MEPVVLNGIFSKASTLSDKSWRLVFDLPEHSSDQINQIYKLKDESLYIVVMTEAQYMASK